MKRVCCLLLPFLLSSCSSEAERSKASQADRTVQRLSAMLGKDKFAEDMSVLYPGCPDPELRRTLNARMDGVIRRFIEAARNDASQEQYLRLVKESLRQFDRDDLDSEDADQVGANFERIMDCVGLESSQGALNMWRYGFDPSVLLRDSRLKN